MELLFFDREDDGRPARVIPIDPLANRTYHYWHMFVPGAQAGQIYGFRAHGPSDPASGLRFDSSKLLLDPNGRAVVVPRNYSRTAATIEGDNTSMAMKSVVVDANAYDWEGDTPLKRPSSRTIVYEMHVRGLTAHPNSGVTAKKRGTYAGLIDKIPYLQQLGITAVELLPIAEAWDAAGLYQVGSFLGDSWKEWNGRFRDDVRDFFRGAEHSVTRIADRFLGSPEIYGHKGREAEQSINFVTCHDGFTLNDLVSYNQKHNEENGEGNRDGADYNRSWNCGVDGPSDDPAVEKLRNRQVKNFLTLTMLSLGVPMIVMGDEVRRSQRGNNNSYCQDNEISWFDWMLLSKHADVHRFVRLLIARRLMRDVSAEHRRLSLNQFLRDSKHAWHGVRLEQPDWSPCSRSVAFSAELAEQGLHLHLILNSYWEPLEFELRLLSEGRDAWRRWIDTALDPPHEIIEWQAAPPVSGQTYQAGARSVVVLMAGSAFYDDHAQ